ncbi:MAG: hypothetical protein JSV16_08320, partial [Candidatus Hydrogenedentota bacterium]
IRVEGLRAEGVGVVAADKILAYSKSADSGSTITLEQVILSAYRLPFSLPWTPPTRVKAKSARIAFGRRHFGEWNFPQFAKIMETERILDLAAEVLPMVTETLVIDITDDTGKSFPWMLARNVTAEEARKGGQTAILVSGTLDGGSAIEAELTFDRVRGKASVNSRLSGVSAHTLTAHLAPMRPPKHLLPSAGSLDIEIEVPNLFEPNTRANGHFELHDVALAKQPAALEPLDGIITFAATSEAESGKILIENLQARLNQIELQGIGAFSGVPGDLHLDMQLACSSVAPVFLDGILAKMIGDSTSKLDTLTMKPAGPVLVSGTAAGPLENLVWNVDFQIRQGKVSGRTEAIGIPIDISDLEFCELTAHWNPPSSPASGSMMIDDATLTAARHLSLDKVEGKIRMNDQVVQVDQMSAVWQGNPMHLKGHMHLSSQPDSELSGEIGFAEFSNIASLLGLPPGIEASGNGSYTFRLTSEPDGRPCARFTVELEECGIEWGNFFRKRAPIPMKVRGELDLSGDMPYIPTLLAELTGTTASLSPTGLPSAPAPSWSTSLSCNPDAADILKDCFPLAGPLSCARAANMRGRLSLKNKLTVFTGTARAESAEFLLLETAVAELDKISAELSSVMEQSSITVHMIGEKLTIAPLPSHIAPAAGHASPPQVAARMNFATIHCGMFEGKSLNAEVHSDGTAVAVKPLRFQLCDGECRGSVKFNPDTGSYKVNGSIEGASVDKFVQTMLGERGRFLGKLSGGFNISGTLDSPDSRKGEGNLRIQDGAFDVDYFFGEGGARIPSDMANFKSLTTDFVIEGDVIRMPNLRVEKPGVVMTSSGYIKDDGTIRYRCYAKMSEEVASKLSWMERSRIAMEKDGRYRTVKFEIEGNVRGLRVKAQPMSDVVTEMGKQAVIRGIDTLSTGGKLLIDIFR